MLGAPNPAELMRPFRGIDMIKAIFNDPPDHRPDVELKWACDTCIVHGHQASRVSGTTASLPRGIPGRLMRPGRLGDLLNSVFSEPATRERVTNDLGAGSATR